MTKYHVEYIKRKRVAKTTQQTKEINKKKKWIMERDT